MRPQVREREPWTKTLRVQGLPDGAVVQLEGSTPRLELTPVLRQFRRLNLMMAVTDAAAIALSLVLSGLLRFGLQAPRADRIWMLGLALPITAGVFAALRLYATYQLAPAEEFRRLIQAVTVVVMALFTLTSWASATLPGFWLAIEWTLAVVLALVVRRFWHWYIWRSRRKGRLLFRTLIVGTNEEARRLAEILSEERLGYRPIGFVVVEPRPGREAALVDSSGPAALAARLPGTPLPLLGSLKNLREVVQRTGAECLFVSSQEVRVGGMAFLAELARLERLELRSTSNFPEVLTHRLAVQPVGGVMALSLKPSTLTPLQAIAKRAFDLVLSSVGLLVALPLFACIALAIKLTSRGPILFRQERVGARGRLFTLYKFRTMVENAESLLEQLMDQNEAAGPLFKLRNDPRITRVGRLLRRWSLDELPQLLNVVRGDMSLVGPRPALPSEAQAYNGRALDRLEAPPGVTGLWQVRGRSDVSFDEYVRLDLFYVENWSLAFDLWILLKTARAIVTGRGAY